MSLSPFKGLDWYSYPGLMQDGFSPECANVESEAGILKSCCGYVRINEKTGCRYFFNHYKNDGSIIRLVFSGGNIENLDSGQVLKSAYYQDGDVLSMVNYQMNDTYITVICNGRTQPVKFDGTSVSNLGGNPPTGSFVELHNERLFMAGSAGNPDRVYYSASFEPESWNVEVESGYIDLPSWDGGRIREIRSMFGDLVVFKDFGIYRIYGTYPGEFGVEKISSNVGCVNKECVTFNGTTCYFISNQGLCVYNGMNGKLIEDKRIAAVFDRVDFNRIGEARIFDYGSKLYMYLPMANEDCVIEYDYSQGMLYRKIGFKVRQFYADKGGLYIVDGDGRVCSYEVGDTYDGQPINAYWKSRSYDLGAKGEFKSVFQLCGLAKGEGMLDINVATENDCFTCQIQLTNDYEYYRMPVRVRGRKFLVEIIGKPGCRFEIDSPYLLIDIEEE